MNWEWIHLDLFILTWLHTALCEKIKHKLCNYATWIESEHRRRLCWHCVGDVTKSFLVVDSIWIPREILRQPDGVVSYVMCAVKNGWGYKNRYLWIYANVWAGMKRWNISHHSTQKCVTRKLCVVAESAVYVRVVTKWRDLRDVW